MKTSKKITIIFLVLASCSCGTQKLSLVRQASNTNRIRLDGFYYNKPEMAHFFLYSNGVVFNGGINQYGNIDYIKYFYQKFSKHDRMNNLPYVWGVYQITDHTIQFEWWRSGDGLDYPTVKFSGKIINDTVLLLDYPAQSVGLDTFYFHPFKNKPDSVNKFIK